MQKICLFLVISLILLININYTVNTEDILSEEVISKFETNGQINLTKIANSSNIIYEGIYRYPAEEKTWLMIMDGKAYYRDVSVAFITLISNPIDGETWIVRIKCPDGTILSFNKLTFYRIYDGKPNCFVWSNGKILENATSVRVSWIYKIQCQKEGVYQFILYNNDAQYLSKDFVLYPQIYPGKVPNFNQGNYNDTSLHSYDSIFKKPGLPYTIKNVGCALTSAVMILNYHKISVTPPELNNWLKTNNGYNSSGGVDWLKIAQFSGGKVKYLGELPNNQLKYYIGAYGPQIIGVKQRADGTCGHWVVATGRDMYNTTWYINDPSGGTSITLDKYSNKLAKTRIYAGPEYVMKFKQIEIHFCSPGEISVTNALGRRTGYNPNDGSIIQQIPDSYYSYSSVDDNETDEQIHQYKELFINNPTDGDNVLEVIGTANGTYSLCICTYDSENNSSDITIPDIPISKGDRHFYNFSYPSSEAIFKISGNFDGGGQRPKDVNKFLSYGNITKSHVDLSFDMRNIKLLIFYNNSILPQTFKAKLNDKDITSTFNPVPGKFEAIDLILVKGKNTLILSVEGTLSNGHIARDTDRITFKVN